MPIEAQDDDVPSSKREVAAREKERLRVMAQQKKERLAQLKTQGEESAEKGQVRDLPLSLRRCVLRFPRQSSSPSTLTHPSPSLPPSLQADRDRNRLQFLLKQAEIFQHFAPPSTEKKKT